MVICGKYNAFKVDFLSFLQGRHFLRLPVYLFAHHPPSKECCNDMSNNGLGTRSGETKTVSYVLFSKKMSSLANKLLPFRVDPRAGGGEGGWGWGGGGGGGVTWVYLWYECASQYFKTYPTTPFIYLAFEKTDPFIYLIIRNVDLFIYCPLIFCTHLLLVVRQISQWIHWIPREQAASKNLWATNICIYQDVGKMGLYT